MQIRPHSAPGTLALLALGACSPAGPVARPTARPEVAPAPPAQVAMSLAQSGIVPAWMDAQVDPCQDFYAHACGGFLESAVIPPDRSSFSAIAVVEQETENFLRDVLERAAASGSDPLVQKLGDYYAACMDEAAIEAQGLKPLAAPLAQIAKVRDAASAAAAVIALHQLAVFPLFDLAPTQDFADATQVILALDQSGLGLPDRKYYLEDGKMKQTREAYLAHVERMFVLYGTPRGELKQAVADVLRIETTLAKLAQDMVVRRDPHAVYHRVDRQGLEALAPSFPWDDYFSALGISDVSAITVNDPAYFAGIARLLREEKPSALVHYFTWTLLHDSAGDLGSAFVAVGLHARQSARGRRGDCAALAPLRGPRGQRPRRAARPTLRGRALCRRCQAARHRAHPRRVRGHVAGARAPALDGRRDARGRPREARAHVFAGGLPRPLSSVRICGRSRHLRRKSPGRHALRARSPAP